MASANATKCLRCFSDQPGEQDLLPHTVLALLEALGTDNTEPFAVDDVLSQLVEIFDPDSLVIDRMGKALAPFRERLANSTT